MRRTQGHATANAIGHPVLILIWSASMLLLGSMIGMHWHKSHAGAVCMSLACALIIVLHEMIEGFIWCTLTAWWIGRFQSRGDR